MIVVITFCFNSHTVDSQVLHCNRDFGPRKVVNSVNINPHLMSTLDTLQKTTKLYRTSPPPSAQKEGLAAKLISHLLWTEAVLASSITAVFPSRQDCLVSSHCLADGVAHNIISSFTPTTLSYFYEEVLDHLLGKCNLIL